MIGGGNHEKASPDATANVQLLDLVLAPLQETVFITDDQGTLVYISPNVDTIFGYTRDDLIRQETLERVFGGRVVDYDELHRVGAVQNIERTVLDKAGGAHILLINVRFVQILHGTALFSCVDITKRMEEEELLRASEARFRLMAENSNDILIFYRLEPAMLIEYITPTVTSIFGYTPEDFYANQNLGWELVHHDDVPSLEQKLYYPNESPQPLTVRMFSKDGKMLWIQFHTAPIADAQGHMMAVVSVARDVTQQKETEFARERALAELQATLDSMADGLVIYSPDGKVIRYNKTVEKMLGSYISNLTKATSPQWLSLHAKKPSGEALQLNEVPAVRALHGEVVHSEVVVFTQPQGKELWVSLSSACITMPDGQVVGVVSTYTDVTVLHQLQQEREDMLHTISHDLRTPLAIIQGHAQELRDQHLSDEAVESVNAILRSTQRLNVMIQDLVDAARVEQQGLHLSCESVELQTFLDDLLARARTVLEVNRINLEIQPNLPAVSADFSRLERIMLNLLSNALKYSPENSPVTVSADMRDQQVVIAITDHGQGIPPEDLPHIFDRFYRSKRGSQVEGMGLGLYITRLLVEAHGGHIWVESKPGVGRTFSFSLPVAKR